MARGKRSWGIQELSDQGKIPIKFLEQILLTLKHAGLLSSRRGVGGGYSLVRPASEITVGEIVRALDGPVAPVPCASERPGAPCTCPDPRSCPVHLMMVGLKDQIASWLDSHTLEEMARLGAGESVLAFEI